MRVYTKTLWYALKYLVVAAYKLISVAAIIATPLYLVAVGPTTYFLCVQKGLLNKHQTHNCTVKDLGEDRVPVDPGPFCGKGHTFNTAGLTW